MVGWGGAGVGSERCHQDRKGVSLTVSRACIIIVYLIICVYGEVGLTGCVERVCERL